MPNEGQISESIEFVQDSPPQTNDRLAEEEKNQLFLQRKRSGEIRKAIHNVSLVAIWVIVIVMMCVFLIRVLHFIMPHCWHWLADSDLQSIDKFLFSGVLGGLVSKHVGKIFENNNSES